jgi:hypothetical protein
MPSRMRNIAAADPAGPPPIIRTSVFMVTLSAADPPLSAVHFASWS